MSFTFRSIFPNRAMVGSFFLTLLFLAGCAAPEDTAQEPSLRNPAPEFVVPSLTSAEDISLKQFKGHIVLLDFMATWDTLSKHEIPQLSSVHNEFRDRGFSVIGLAVDRGSIAELRTSVRGLEPAFPVGRSNPDLQEQYGKIRAIPTKLLIDGQGGIRKTYQGVVGIDTIRDDIEMLLAE